MSELSVTSTLSAEHRDELERLLFFNENQERASEGVAHVVNTYGTPRIQINEERLRINLDKSAQPQTLYAITQAEGGVRPVGVVVYLREDDTIVVLFIAVDTQYTSRGNKGNRRVFSRLIGAVKNAARRVRGIDTVLVYTGRAKPTRMKLRRGSDSA